MPHLNYKDMLEQFLTKIPTDKVYEDLFQPGMKKAGEALATVIDVSNSILLPIKLLNERSKLIFESNIKRYSKKLENIDQNELQQVPEYVGLPILDKLTYISEHTLSEAFINLLTKASSTKTINLVHPSFISTLNDLSKDEASILFQLQNKDTIPFIDLYAMRSTENVKKPEHFDTRGPKTREQLKQSLNYTFQDREEAEIKWAWNLTGIENYIKLDFPKNIDIYLYNLEKHNLIIFEREIYRKNQIPEYEKLEYEYYKDIIQKFQEEINSFNEDSKPENKTIKLEIKRGEMIFTDYGLAFLRACMSDI